jgi:hypothetical protein
LLLILLAAAAATAATPRLSEPVVVRDNVLFSYWNDADVAGVPGNLMTTWVGNQNRIFVGRLDDDYKVIEASVQEIGRGGFPQLEFDGTHFVLAWSDFGFLKARRLDDGREVLLGDMYFSLIGGIRPPGVPFGFAWRDGRFRVQLGGDVLYEWPLTSQLDAEPPVAVIRNLGDSLRVPLGVAATNNIIGVANFGRDLHFGTTISPTAPYARIFGYQSEVMPAVATSGSEFLVVTQTDCASECGDVRAIRFALDGTLLGDTKLDGNLRFHSASALNAAWTGTGYLVVYTRRPSFGAGRDLDLWGVLIAADGTGGEPFPISETAEQIDVGPSLLPLGGGRLLVTYHVGLDRVEARVLETAVRAARPIRAR